MLSVKKKHKTKAEGPFFDDNDTNDSEWG